VQGVRAARGPPPLRSPQGREVGLCQHVTRELDLLDLQSASERASSSSSASAPPSPDGHRPAVRKFGASTRIWCRGGTVGQAASLPSRKVRSAQGQGLGDAARLDEEVVETSGAGEPRDLLQQVVAQRAADAAVGHLDQLLVDAAEGAGPGAHQRRVDVDLAHVVDDHRDPAPLAVREDVVEVCLAAPRNPDSTVTGRRLMAPRRGSRIGAGHRPAGAGTLARIRTSHL